MSIPSIFIRLGKEEFRRLESEALNFILSIDETAVIALGGGSLLRKNNLLLVRKKGIIITPA